MSSWTDNIPKFNPYVEQLPVKAMVEVGMEKQKRYEEGVKKIQAQIDSVAGIDLVRDVDKAYLQSKLNELGNNLKVVAAGDFSNYQLVNSITGMTGQIVKDPYVKNAVISTAAYREGIKQMKDAQKNGKSSASNDWLFNSQAGEWLNSKDLGTSFGASYKQYTNYKKNALDVIKNLTKDSTITDDAFTIDENGKVVITDAIVRKKMAGISPEKVQQALMASLSPDDFEQMQIDGRYNYSNTNRESFAKNIYASYTNKVSSYQEQKAILQNSRSSTTSAAEKSKIDEKIASLDKIIDSLSSEYKDITSKFSEGDVESAKAKLGTYDFMHNFSKSFSFTETSQTYEDSPFVKAEQWRKDKELDWKKFMLTYDQDERHFQIEQETKRLEAEAKGKSEAGYGGLPSAISQDLLPKYNLTKVVSDIDNGTKELGGIEYNFLQKKGKDTAWLEQQRIAYNQGKSIDPDVKDYFLQTEEMQRRLDADKRMVADINKQATEKFGTIDKYIPKDAKAVTYRDPSGEYVFTPKDMVDFNSIIDRYVKPSKISGGGGSPMLGMAPAGQVITQYDDALAEKELSPKMYKLYQLNKAYQTGNTHPAVKTVVAALDNTKKTVNIPYSNVVKQINDFTADEVTKRITSAQAVDYGIPLTNPAQKSTFGNVLVSFANLAKQQTGGLPNSPDFDADIAIKNAADENGRAIIKVVEGTEKQPRMYEITSVGKGGTTTFRVTPEEKDAVFGQMFEPSPDVKAIRPYQEAIKKNGGYSTAPKPGPTTPENSYLGRVDFPNVGSFGVRGNLVNSREGGYTITLSIYDPIKGDWVNDIPYPPSGLIDETQINPFMKGLNDSVVFELLYGIAPKAADLEKIKEASKIPL